MNAQYSYGDFTQQDLSDADRFDGDVVGSCFQQDSPDTVAFPADANATFFRCNLNNCRIPAGCTIGSGSCNYQHSKQNDGEQWILDGSGKPIEPLGKKQFQRLNLSTDAKDIPASKLSKSVTQTAYEREAAQEEIGELQRRITELEAV